MAVIRERLMNFSYYLTSFEVGYNLVVLVRNEVQAAVPVLEAIAVMVVFHANLLVEHPLLLAGFGWIHRPDVGVIVNRSDCFADCQYQDGRAAAAGFKRTACGLLHPTGAAAEWFRPIRLDVAHGHTLALTPTVQHLLQRPRSEGVPQLTSSYARL